MDKIWYYLNHITKEKAGPYTDEELIKLLNQGVVDVDEGFRKLVKGGRFYLFHLYW